MNRLCFNRVWRPQWKTRTQTFQKRPHPPSQVLKETIVHCWTSCTSPDSLTSDLALMSMLQTFLSFLVFPAASSCRLAYFSSMSILSCCKKEKPVIPVHYYTMYLTNNYTLCSSLLLWFFLSKSKHHRLNVTNNHIQILSKCIFISYIFKPVSIPTSFWGVSSWKD